MDDDNFTNLCVQFLKLIKDRVKCRCKNQNPKSQEITIEEVLNILKSFKIKFNDEKIDDSEIQILC